MIMTLEPPVAETVVETPCLRMTYEEYLDWHPEDILAEWVEGEVIVHMPPLEIHQSAVTFMDRLIGLFVEMLQLGRLKVAPFEVRLNPDGPSREPDLLFIDQAHMNRLTPKRVDGAPDLVIEIVSDDSVQRDRVTKFDEYERAGVREYWIIDNRPDHQRAWFYRLGDDGRFATIPLDDGGVFRSTVLPGFWLRQAWLFDPAPDAIAAIAHVLGPDRVADALRQALAERPGE